VGQRLARTVFGYGYAGVLLLFDKKNLHRPAFTLEYTPRTMKNNVE
jgi:hypothetical protein